MKQNNSLDERLAALQAAKVREIFLQPGGAGAKALDMALSAIYFADHVIGLVEGATPLPDPIACREGCSFCCYIQVELSPPEALFLGRFVEQHFSGDEKQELLARGRRSLKFKAGKSKAEIARIREKPPCPLLRDRRCAAHPARPLVCRAMHAMDARACEQAPKTPHLSSPPYYAHRHDIYFSVSQGLLDGCRDLGLQAGPLELTQSLLDYFREPQPMERWLQGEKVFTSGGHP